MVSELQIVFEHQEREPTEIKAERIRRADPVTAAAPPPAPVIDPQVAQDARELVASRRDVTEAITSQIEFIATAHGITPAEAAERVRSPIEHDVLAHGPEHVGWSTLANLMEHNPDGALAVWSAIKQAARTELQTGLRAARSIESHATDPMDRAQFSVILEWLTDSLNPQNGLETMLIQQLATAHEQWLRWQGRATMRVESEVSRAAVDLAQQFANMSQRERDRYETEHGWMPLRLSETEAIDHAVLTADRYLRSFQRILRTLREQRRIMGSVVMMGGQLNVAERQINMSGSADGDCDPDSDNRTVRRYS